MATEVGCLQEAATKRKERLEALRAKREYKVEFKEANCAKDVDNSEKLPRPQFRSYKPQDESLKENALSPGQPGNVEEKIESQLEAAKSKSEMEEDLDLINLAPRKPDWDLKRDVAKKLEKLERKTQRAIAELIRERLKTKHNDLLTVFDATETLARGDAEEDD